MAKCKKKKVFNQRENMCKELINGKSKGEGINKISKTYIAEIQKKREKKERGGGFLRRREVRLLLWGLIILHHYFPFHMHKSYLSLMMINHP